MASALERRQRFVDWSTEQNKKMDAEFLSKLSDDKKTKYNSYVTKRDAALAKLLDSQVTISEVKSELSRANVDFPGGLDDFSIEQWKCVQGINEWVLTQELFIGNMINFKQFLESQIAQATGINRLALDGHLKTVNKILMEPFDVTTFLMPTDREPVEVLRASQEMFENTSFLQLLANIHRLTFETPFLENYFSTKQPAVPNYQSQLILATQYLSQTTTMMGGLGDSFKILSPNDDATPKKQSMMANKFKKMMASFQAKDKEIDALYKGEEWPRIWPEGLSNESSVSPEAFEESLRTIDIVVQKKLVEDVVGDKWPKGLFLMPGMSEIDFVLSWAKLLSVGNVKDKTPQKTALALAEKAYALAGDDLLLQGKVLAVFNPDRAGSVGAWIGKSYQQGMLGRALGFANSAYKERKVRQLLEIKSKLLPKEWDYSKSVRSASTSVSMASTPISAASTPVSPVFTSEPLLSKDSEKMPDLRPDSLKKRVSVSRQTVRREAEPAVTLPKPSVSEKDSTPKAQPTAKVATSPRKAERIAFKPVSSRSTPAGGQGRSTSSNDWALFENLRQLFKKHFGNDETHPTMISIVNLMQDMSGKNDNALAELARAMHDCVIADKHAENMSAGMPFARHEHAPHVNELYFIMKQPGFSLDTRTINRLMSALTEDSDKERDVPKK